MLPSLRRSALVASRCSSSAGRLSRISTFASGARLNTATCIHQTQSSVFSLRGFSSSQGQGDSKTEEDAKQQMLNAPERELGDDEVDVLVNSKTGSGSQERAQFILQDVKRQIRERQEKKKKQGEEPTQKMQIPAAGAVPDYLSNIKGAKRTSGPKMVLRFTCDYKGECEQDVNVEKSRVVTKVISRNTYENGVVLVRCPCEKLHLIADNLKYFGDEKNIEEIMANTNNTVERRQMIDDDLLHLE